MNFKQYINQLEEQGFVNSITNFFKPKAPATTPSKTLPISMLPDRQSTAGPKNGDNIKIFYLYKNNGTYVVSDTTEGRIFIAKDGSIHIQHDNNMTSKIANNIQQANLKPNGNRSWKLDRHLD